MHEFVALGKVGSDAQFLGKGIDLLFEDAVLQFEDRARDEDVDAFDVLGNAESIVTVLQEVDGCLLHLGIVETIAEELDTIPRDAWVSRCIERQLVHTCIKWMLEGQFIDIEFVVDEVDDADIDILLLLFIIVEIGERKRFATMTDDVLDDVALEAIGETGGIGCGLCRWSWFGS